MLGTHASELIKPSPGIDGNPRRKSPTALSCAYRRSRSASSSGSDGSVMGTPYLVVDQQPDSQNNLPRCGTPTYVSRTLRGFGGVRHECRNSTAGLVALGAW